MEIDEAPAEPPPIGVYVRWGSDHTEYYGFPEQLEEVDWLACASWAYGDPMYGEVFATAALVTRLYAEERVFLSFSENEDGVKYASATITYYP
tara:strand:+ start:4716 stop:4994 length:279 start_codon:yes stop_codon:yes gene_type:complete